MPDPRTETAHALSSSATDSQMLEVSIVMPCLNEAETLRACVAEAREAIEGSGVSGEVLIADNGSTDGSQAIAEDAGVRVVNVTDRGYGSAPGRYRGGKRPIHTDGRRRWGSYWETQMVATTLESYHASSKNSAAAQIW